MISLRLGIFTICVSAVACVDVAPGGVVLGELESLNPPLGEVTLWPGLSSQGDKVVLSWQENDSGEIWSVKTAILDEAGWAPAHTVARSTEATGFFVNWADFASVQFVGSDLLVAHWLVRGPNGGYDYGVRVARSTDGGREWTEPWIPHTDGTRTEHGFVSKFPLHDGGFGLVWLDGRNSVDRAGVTGTPGAMGLRYRSLDHNGVPGPEVLIDDRVCDCCQTDVAVSRSGPVVVYRDRSEKEVRDIYFARLIEGKWTEGAPVHRDGWVIPACPVNGPAVAAREDEIVVAWFTGAENQRKAKVAFSSDGGVNFGEPIRIDEGTALGRVDVLWLENGSALVMWVERRPRMAEILVRQVWPDRRIEEEMVLTTISAGRDSGFPRMVQDGKGRVVFAWTDTGEGRHVRVARTREALR